MQEGIKETPEAILWHRVLSRAVRDLQLLAAGRKKYHHMERASMIRSLRTFFLGEESSLGAICLLHDYDVKTLRRWAAPLLHELKARERGSPPEP